MCCCRETQPDTYTVIEKSEKILSGAAGSDSHSRGKNQICEEDDDEEKSNSDAEKEQREKNEQVRECALHQQPCVVLLAAIIALYKLGNFLLKIPAVQLFLLSLCRIP